MYRFRETMYEPMTHARITRELGGHGNYRDYNFSETGLRNGRRILSKEAEETLVSHGYRVNEQGDICYNDRIILRVGSNVSIFGVRVESMSEIGGHKEDEGRFIISLRRGDPRGKNEELHCLLNKDGCLPMSEFEYKKLMTRHMFGGYGISKIQ